MSTSVLIFNVCFHRRHNPVLLSMDASIYSKDDLIRSEDSSLVQVILGARYAFLVLGVRTRVTKEGPKITEKITLVGPSKSITKYKCTSKVDSQRLNTRYNSKGASDKGSD